jgi:hypothetical protein
MLMQRYIDQFFSRNTPLPPIGDERLNHALLMLEDPKRDIYYPSFVKSADVFTVFPQLPAELRSRIW